MRKLFYSKPRAAKPIIIPKREAEEGVEHFLLLGEVECWLQSHS